MSVTNYANTFNVGSDQSISIFPASALISQILAGAVIPAATAFFDGKRSSFNMKATDVTLKSEVIDDLNPDFRVLPDGWSGRCEVEKQNNSFSVLYGFLQQNIANGAAQDYWTIIESIRNPVPGSPLPAVQKYAYLGVVWHDFDPGTWTKKTVIKATVDISAKLRMPL